MRATSRLRSNEKKSEREFNLFESEWESVRVHENLRSNESESGRELIQTLSKCVRDDENA